MAPVTPEAKERAREREKQRKRRNNLNRPSRAKQPEVTYHTCMVDEYGNGLRSPRADRPMDHHDYFIAVLRHVYGERMP